MTNRKRILIVDDEATIRRVLSRLLAGSGHEIMTAEDGREALEMIQQRPPDLVLLDINMPRLGGMRLLELVKKIRPGLPVIMVTGVDDPDQALATMSLGAEDYVTKPFDFDYIDTAIKANLAARCV
ncbi:MAG: response regulator [Elusimicrobiota bacterium]